MLILTYRIFINIDCSHPGRFPIAGCISIFPHNVYEMMHHNSYFLPTGGYNVKDVVFFWTRGNQSVSGLDTLQLAQYTLEDYYTSESEAVYETGMLSHYYPTDTQTSLFTMHPVLLRHFLLGRYPKLIFHFQLRRSILYFILETYVPSSALVVLSWVSFWISQASVPARICIGMDR